jgi:hypothetical protein
MALADSPSYDIAPLSHRKTEKERQLADERRVGGGRGAKAYDVEKAWSSINHSIFSVDGRWGERVEEDPKTNDGEKAWPSINQAIITALDPLKCGAQVESRSQND